MRRLIVMAIGLGVLCACTDGATSSAEPDAQESDAEVSEAPEPDLLGAVIPLEGCNPVAQEWSCFYPFPTDLFLTTDDALPSGYRVAVPAAAQPEHVDGGPAEALIESDLDGASVFPMLEVLLPAPIDAQGLLSHADPAAAQPTPDSPTLLIDTVTGELVAHFAETKPDPSLGDGPLLAIRPLSPLEPSRRYVVALQGITGSESELPLPAPEIFKALRDRTSDDAPMQRYYDARVFAPLEALEVVRGDLLLAWAFTTGSDALRTGRLLSIRDQLDAHFKTNTPVVTVTEVVDDPAPHIARRLHGTFEVPSFVSDAEPGARLTLDDDGVPTMGAPFDVPFVAYIPRSVVDGLAIDGPARLLQFGHGFFGSMGEVGGYPVDLASEHGFVVIAVEWWGMSEADRATLIQAISGPIHEATRFIERTHQGMANALALGYAAQQTFPTLDAFQFEGEPAFDPTDLYFLGISQGHILGGVFAALSPLTKRVVLNGGGASLGFIMTRSRSFGLFEFVIDQVLASPRDTQRMLSLLASALDPIDPVAWAHRARDRDDLTLLLQTGIGDAEVPSQSAHIHARGLGLPLMSPSPRDLPGFALFEGPHPGSGLVEFDFGLTPDPTQTWTIPDGNEVHEGLRRLPAVKAQISAFLWPDGQIEATCLGVCDPE
jgi:hypothetical protein